MSRKQKIFYKNLSMPIWTRKVRYKSEYKRFISEKSFEKHYWNCRAQDLRNSLGKRTIFFKSRTLVVVGGERAWGGGESREGGPVGQLAGDPPIWIPGPPDRWDGQVLEAEEGWKLLGYTWWKVQKLRAFKVILAELLVGDTNWRETESCFCFVLLCFNDREELARWRWGSPVLQVRKLGCLNTESGQDIISLVTPHQFLCLSHTSIHAHNFVQWICLKPRVIK